MRYGMFLDTSLCIGCRGCMTACKSWNRLPGEKTSFTGSLQSMPDSTANTFTLIKYYERVDNGKIHFDFFKQQCLHCGEAACEKACPEKAVSRTQTGAVVRNYDKCIGCDYCQRFCPFNIPRINIAQKKMYKCTLCFDRLENGKTPACAQTCSTGAIKFGNRDELVAYSRKRLTEARKTHKSANLYPADENALGGTGVFYLLVNPPSFYGLPEKPGLSDSFIIWHDALRPLGSIIPGLTLGVTAVAALANVIRNRNSGEVK